MIRKVGMRTHMRFLCGALMVVGLAVSGGTAEASQPSFTATPLLLAMGSSEPEIFIGNDGTMAMVSLQWLFDPTAVVGTELWTRPFGTKPTLQGIVDGSLQHPGKSTLGGGDADVDIGSTGRLHISTLIALVNNPFNHAQSGVSAITCPSPASGTFAISQCTAQIIDTTNGDRPWVTSDGPHVYISYHDARNDATCSARMMTASRGRRWAILLSGRVEPRAMRHLTTFKERLLQTLRPTTSMTSMPRVRPAC